MTWSGRTPFLTTSCARSRAAAMKHPLRTGRLSWLALTALSTGSSRPPTAISSSARRAPALPAPVFLARFAAGKEDGSALRWSTRKDMSASLDHPAAFPIGTLRITVEKQTRFTSISRTVPQEHSGCADPGHRSRHDPACRARSAHATTVFGSFQQTSCDAPCTFWQIPAAASPSRSPYLQHPSSAPQIGTWKENGATSMRSGNTGKAIP